MSDWVEIQVAVTSGTEEAVSNLLCELGSNGVVLVDGEHGTGSSVAGYIPAGERIHDKVRRIRELWDGLCGLGLADGDCQIAIRHLPASDWATEWQGRFVPIQVSDRLIVKPPWATVSGRADQVVIDILPGMAFGTGEHETTQLCLRALDRTIRPGDRVLDVGTGSGVLAIAAARLGAGEVTAVDTDDVAVENARSNIVRNRMSDRVHVACGSLDHPSVRGSYRVILSNLDTRTILRLSAAWPSRLDPDGTLILSGVLSTEGEEVVQSLRAQGLDVIQQATMGEWWSGAMRKSEELKVKSEE
ncbi:MAG: 50S ribosomal protein L11 methyltransferase [Candidatus Latescibacteria bacterium]|nr:50S ribosomal protein L11 methyltransferase [Candidatus Latescibacterota bacterium]